MGTDDEELSASTLHPDLLRKFIAELEASGFQRVDARSWRGPRPDALDGIAASDSMTIIVRNGWPYRPPQTRVEGIESWHADRDNLCLWQDGDNTRKWTTLAGIHDRIREWVDDYETGFSNHGVGRDPELYFNKLPRLYALIDIDEILGASPADGQTGRMNFSEYRSSNLAEPLDEVLDIRPGPHTAQDPLPLGISDRRQVRGRWFYREAVDSPPRDLDDIRRALTPGQLQRFDADLGNQHVVVRLLGLFWRSPAGIVGSVLSAIGSRDRVLTEPVALRPKGRAALIRRAGPDSNALHGQHVLIFGVGAIGSHVASLLGRSGIGKLDLVDGDNLWPTNLVRHAAAPTTPPNWPKPAAMEHALQPFEWIDITRYHASPWSPADLRQLMNEDADLIIDATGDAAFADYLSRVAAEQQRPFVSVALYRGGSVSRVRRQADPGDTPLSERNPHTGYPTIAPLARGGDYLDSLETGCVAPINNAPPAAVVRAAALAAEVALDALSGRWDYEDEVIDVIRPTDGIFSRTGHLRLNDVPIAICVSESAQAAMRQAAANHYPNETGGVLIGTRINGVHVIQRAVELAADQPTPARYEVSAKRVTEAIEQARAGDGRLGYVGEFHSHPSDHGPSPTDRRMMQRLLDDGDTGHPVLIVVRPQSGSSARLDAYVATPGGLRPADIETVGPLHPPTDTQEAGS